MHKPIFYGSVIMVFIKNSLQLQAKDKCEKSNPFLQTENLISWMFAKMWCFFKVNIKTLVAVSLKNLATTIKSSNKQYFRYWNTILKNWNWKCSLHLFCGFLCKAICSNDSRVEKVSKWFCDRGRRPNHLPCIQDNLILYFHEKKKKSENSFKLWDLLIQAENSLYTYIYFNVSK